MLCLLVLRCILCAACCKPVEKSRTDGFVKITIICVILMFHRVPFRSIVVGLLSHQLLVQTVGILLLQGSSNVVSAVQHMMPTLASRGSRSSSTEEGRNDDLIEDAPLPGELLHQAKSLLS